jgi:hypothetical protein
MQLESLTAAAQLQDALMQLRSLAEHLVFCWQAMLLLPAVRSMPSSV